MRKLINLLKNTQEVSEYKITESKTHSYQLFFVKDKLETNRVSDSILTEVTVYVDVEGMRGSASFKYSDYMGKKEVKDLIKEAIFNAKLALNPFYEIPGVQSKPKALKSNMKGKDLKEIAEDVAHAVFENKMDDVNYSSATEIFINKVNKTIVNSKGLKVSQEKYYGEIELIPTYDTKDNEVEVYHMIKFSDFDYDGIKNEVADVLKMAKDRHDAIDLPKNVKNVNIIIDGSECGEVFDYFVEDLNYSCKYTKSNLFEIGGSVQGEKVRGTKLTLSLVPQFKGCSSSTSFDNDGIVLKDTKLVDKSVAVSRYGRNQFGYYLDEKEIKGDIPITKVNPGRVPFASMAKKPYIRCVRFSSMQLDRASGLVGGEVRLGYYFDGEKEIPVTGFTFTGNMHELKGRIVLSKETATYSFYHGPKYLLLPKTKII